VAFRSNGPVTVSLPPFRGVTRRIILLAVVAYFAFLLCSLFSAQIASTVMLLFTLQSDPAYHKFLWQFVTYPFISSGLLGILFGALTVWFFGSALEDELGGRWMTEFFLVCTALGGVAACVFAYFLSDYIGGLGPGRLADSLWPFSLALLLVYARLHPDQELHFNFLLRIKAKYIAIVYLLVYLAILLAQQQRFETAVVLANALAGYLYLRLAPRRGFGFASSEGLYGLRNAWYRAKRRRAARKFTVYMQKQGRDVHFDESGRYLDPDAEQRGPGRPRDPNDRRWMN
jgi:membrane associated rhomboid family serine protease